MADTLSGNELNLIAAWNFENVNDQIVPDITGNGHDAVLIGRA